MTEERIHRTRSRDGTELAGRVLGQGPPLVLVHGILEDGDQCWAALGPLLRERFTCFLMSTRGRGLSEAHPDVREERLVEDVTAFVESIGEPAALVGESSGAVHALGAAARSAAVSAVVAHEPPAHEVVDDRVSARLDDALARVQDAIERGALSEAAAVFNGLVGTEREREALASSGYEDQSARYMPLVLEEVKAGAVEGAFSPTAPEVLERVRAPVLLLHGQRTALAGWFKPSIRHVAEHVPHAEIRELRGTGHFAPVLHPEALTREMLPFLERVVGLPDDPGGRLDRGLWRKRHANPA
jgi:pimeloyl-ACP methyl ester carboxylesterase